MGCCGSCFKNQQDLDRDQTSNQEFLSYLHFNPSDINLQLTNKQKGELMSVLKPLPSMFQPPHRHSSDDDVDIVNANTLSKRVKRAIPPPLDPKILIPKRLALVPIKQLDTNNNTSIPKKSQSGVIAATPSTATRIPLGMFNLNKPLEYNLESHFSSRGGDRVTKIQITKPSTAIVSPEVAPTITKTINKDNLVLLRVIRRKDEGVETDAEEMEVINNSDDNQDSSSSSSSSSEEESSSSSSNVSSHRSAINNNGDEDNRRIVQKNMDKSVQDCATQSCIEVESDSESEAEQQESLPQKPRKKKVKKRQSRRQRARHQQEYCAMLAQPKKVNLPPPPPPENQEPTSSKLSGPSQTNNNNFDNKPKKKSRIYNSSFPAGSSNNAMPQPQVSLNEERTKRKALDDNTSSDSKFKWTNQNHQETMTIKSKRQKRK